MPTMVSKRSVDYVLLKIVVENLSSLQRKQQDLEETGIRVTSSTSFN